jgi:hypothetical protein
MVLTTLTLVLLPKIVNVASQFLLFIFKEDYVDRLERWHESRSSEAAEEDRLFQVSI